MFRFWVTSIPETKFAIFRILRYRQKIFQKYKQLVKKMKIDILFENGCSFMKEYELRHILSPFWWKSI